MAGSGKETLIKLAAQAVPNFSMSCFLLPRGLCEQIDMMLRKFFGGGGGVRMEKGKSRGSHGTSLPCQSTKGV